jgi:hypothetical protein
MARAIRSCPVAEIRGAVEGTTAAGKVLIPTTGGVVDALDVTTLKIGGAVQVSTTGIAATAAEINSATDKSSYAAAYTATSPAAIPATVRCVELNHGSTAIEKTIADLTVYANQFITLRNTSATGTAAHTITVTTGTLNGTNKVATLDAPKDALVIWVDSAGNGTVVVNVGSVGFSG